MTVLSNFGGLSTNPLPITPAAPAGNASPVISLRPLIDNNRYPFAEVRTINGTITIGGTGNITAFRVEASKSIGGPASWVVDTQGEYGAPQDVKQALNLPPNGLAAGQSFNFSIGQIPNSGNVEYRIYATGDGTATVGGSIKWDPQST